MDLPVVKGDAALIASASLSRADRGRRHCHEGFIHRANRLVNVALCNIERWGHADHISVQATFADQQSALAALFQELVRLLRSRFFGGAVFDEFDGLHQSHAPHIADKLILLLQVFKALAEVVADGGGVIHQPVFFNQFNGSLGGDGSNGITTERRDLQALEAGGDFRTRKCSSHRHSVGQPFGGSDDIRRDLPLLDSKPAFAGAAPAGLYFVGDKEAAVVLHNFEDDLEELFRRSDKAAYALNRLSSEGGNLPGGRVLDDGF